MLSRNTVAGSRSDTAKNVNPDRNTYNSLSETILFWKHLTCVAEDWDIQSDFSIVELEMASKDFSFTFPEINHFYHNFRW